MRIIPKILELITEQSGESEGIYLLKDKDTGYPLLIKSENKGVLGNVPRYYFYIADEAAIAFVLNYKRPEIEQECLGSIHYRSENCRWYFTQGLTLPQHDEQRSVESINQLITNKAAELASQSNFYALVCTSALDACSGYAKYIVSDDGFLQFIGS